MTRRIASAALTLALLGLALGSATTALASPGKKSACSGCHHSSSTVKITITKKKATSKKVTYAVKVSGGSGATGWAVLAGGKNLARKTSSKGTFTLTKGKKVRVWAVKTGAGATSKYLRVR